MNVFTQIIPIGCNCVITNMLQHLKIKKETSLFEWFQSDTLSAINNTMSKIDWQEFDTSVVGGKDKHIELGNKNIYSYHYTLNEYRPIFVRRAQRFIHTIRSTDSVLFLRFDLTKYKTTLDEILEFRSIIESLKLENIDKMKFMLVSTKKSTEEFVPIKHDYVIHKCMVYNIEPDWKIENDPPMIAQLKIFLNEVGYNINDINNIKWTDFSEL